MEADAPLFDTQSPGLSWVSFRVGYGVAMQAIHILPASSYNTIACFVTMESPGEAIFMIRALNNTEVQLRPGAHVLGIASVPL